MIRTFGLPSIAGLFDPAEMDIISMNLKRNRQLESMNSFLQDLNEIILEMRLQTEKQLKAYKV